MLRAVNAGPRRWIVTAALLLGSTTAGMHGQAPSAPPATNAPSAPAVDLSGYWSPVLHEDGLDRGAGPEIADYGGLPLNEAGRSAYAQPDRHPLVQPDVRRQAHDLDGRPSASAGLGAAYVARLFDGPLRR
jgi:hypothetical protein